MLWIRWWWNPIPVMMNRPWTKQHDEFLMANFDSAPVDIIARCLNRPKWDVKQRIKQLKLI